MYSAVYAEQEYGGIYAVGEISFCLLHKFPMLNSKKGRSWIKNAFKIIRKEQMLKNNIIPEPSQVIKYRDKLG